MEQESEGQSAKMRILEFERKVRMEALSGCSQLKTVEHHIQHAPEGLLGVGNGGAEAEALRTAILNASAAIVEKFSKVIRLLSTPPNSSRITTKAQEQIIAKAGALRLDGDSPPDERNPSLSPPQGPAPSANIRVSSPNASSCHTPLSGSGMSEGSSGRQNQVALDSDDETGGNPGRRRSYDASTSATPEYVEKPALPKKRKYLPKCQMKQRATGTGDHANDGPPDDGYTWRKYGQKDIKESTYPRSYYRCTHKTDLGCPSIKMVQRSDEDPNYYDVTYRGQHICPTMEQRTWHFGLAPSHIAIHDLLSSDPKGGPSTFLPGGVPLGSTRTLGQSQASHLIVSSSGRTPFPPVLGSTEGLTLTPKSSTSPMMFADRFGVSPPASSQQQNIPSTSGGLNQSDHDGRAGRESTLPRDILFEPGLLKLLMEDGTSTGNVGGPLHHLELEDLSFEVHQRQEAQTEAAGPKSCSDVMRSQSFSSSVRMARSDPYLEGRAESDFILAYEFSSEAQQPEGITGRYTPSPATSEVITGHAQQQIRPVGADFNRSTSQLALGNNSNIYNIHSTESDASEVISPASPPFAMTMDQYMINSPGSHQQMYGMDYEFGTSMYYEAPHTD